jgi:hypothetical protein
MPARNRELRNPSLTDPQIAFLIEKLKRER